MIVFVGDGPLAYLCYQQLLTRNLITSCGWKDLVTDADLLISVQYNHKVENAILQKFHLCVNLHTGLLPNNKGVNTCTVPILRGDSETGVTLHEMTEELDAGDVILQSVYPILSSDTCESLYYKAVSAGVNLFSQFLDLLTPYKSGRISSHKIRTIRSNKTPQAPGGYRTLRNSIDFAEPIYEDDPLFKQKLRAHFFPQKQFPIVVKDGRRLKLTSLLPERYEAFE